MNRKVFRGRKRGGMKFFPASREICHERLLDMEPVSGLFENNRIFSLKHLFGDLFPPVSGQTMQNDTIPPCKSEKPGIDLKILKIMHPLVPLRFLAHTYPDI